MEVTSKKEIALVVVIIVSLEIFFSGCIQPSTYQGRRPIWHLSLSDDGSRVLSITEDSFHISPINGNITRGRDLQVWDTRTGELLWSEYPAKFSKEWEYDSVHGFQEEAYLSPDGKYIIKKNSSVYNVSSGEVVANLLGYYKDWTVNNKFIVTAEYNNIHIWDATNFSKIRTISINKSIYEVYAAAISPDGNKLCYITRSEKGSYIISMVDISSEDIRCLWNRTINNSIGDLSWSNNADSIQMVRRPTGFVYPDYRVTIFNASNGNVKEKLFFKFEQGKLNLYNLSGLKKTFNVDFGYISTLDLSRDGNIIALGSEEGVIEIRNFTTGEPITTLKTPLREIVRPTPGFELIFTICALVLILFWKRKR